MDSDTFIIVGSRNSQNNADNNKDFIPLQKEKSKPPKSDVRNQFKNVYATLGDKHNQSPYFAPKVTFQKKFFDKDIPSDSNSSALRLSAPIKLEARTPEKNIAKSQFDNQHLAFKRDKLESNEIMDNSISTFSDNITFLKQNNISFEQYKLRGSLINEPSTNSSIKKPPRYSSGNKPPRYSSSNTKKNGKKDDNKYIKPIAESKILYNLDTTPQSGYRNKSKDLASVSYNPSDDQRQSSKQFEEFSIKFTPLTLIENEAMVSSKPSEFEFPPLGFERSSETNKKAQRMSQKVKEVINLSINVEPKPENSPFLERAGFFQDNSFKKYTKSDDPKESQGFLASEKDIFALNHPQSSNLNKAIPNINEFNENFLINSEDVKKDTLNESRILSKLAQDNKFLDENINEKIINKFENEFEIIENIDFLIINEKIDINIGNEITKGEDIAEENHKNMNSLINTIHEQKFIVDPEILVQHEDNSIILLKADAKTEIFKQNKDEIECEDTQDIKVINSTIINEPEPLTRKTNENISNHFSQDSTEKLSEIAELTCAKIEYQEKKKKKFLPRMEQNQISLASLSSLEKNINNIENNGETQINNFETNKQEEKEEKKEKEKKDEKYEKELNLENFMPSTPCSSAIYDKFTPLHKFGFLSAKYFKSIQPMRDSISENKDPNMIQLEGLGCVIISGPDETHKNSILERRFTEIEKKNTLVPQEETESLKSSTVLITRSDKEKIKSNYNGRKISTNSNFLDTYIADQSLEISNEENNQKDEDPRTFSEIRLSTIKQKKDNEKKSNYPAFKTHIYLGNDKELIKLSDDDEDFDNRTSISMNNKRLSAKSKIIDIDENAALRKRSGNDGTRNNKFNEEKSSQRSPLKKEKDQSIKNDNKDTEQARDSCNVLELCIIF